MTDLITAEEVQRLANNLAYSVLDVETSEELDPGAYAHLSVSDAKRARVAVLACIALHAQLADAEAAQAAAVERCAERLDLAEHDAEERDWRSGANSFEALAREIRALAPASGVETLAKLRAEISSYQEQMKIWHDKLEAADTERDTLAARLAASEGREKALAVQLENLLAVYSEPDRQLCCSGHMCGCQGATAYQEAEYYARAELAAAIRKETP